MSIAAQMTERVTLQLPSTAQDANGEPVGGWVNLIPTGDGKLWANVSDQSGREFRAAAATQAETLTQITIQQRAGLTPAMRVLHGADIYNVRAVLRQLNGAALLMCEKGLNRG